ncbi:Precorrin-6A reductase [Labrenzia sp. THAF82]|nr:cobalt-precorrin-6A reductase [Labrenzia sp. THAF82]QFT34398.1 Precorrin-6A reductase [Labrenzia sp. THAF82]
MTRTLDHILLLAGTSEARQLAKSIAQRFAAVKLTVSFAGVVKDLPDLGVPTRIGGFGGVDGLVSYLQEKSVDLIIDATHPFAAQMSRHAVDAAGQTDTHLIRLERPIWHEVDGDTWQHVASTTAAAEALPKKSRAFLSVGRKEIDKFTYRDDCFALVRMIEPPERPLPDHWHLVLERPSKSVDAERHLLKHHKITHLVTKNSGGASSYAKIEAARQLQVPLLMIKRPALPDADTASSTAEVLKFVEQFVDGCD